MKKLLAIMLSILMLTSVLSVYAYAFDDVTEYEDEINKLYELGIISGKDAEGKIFDPDSLVLRWQMALFVAKAMTGKVSDPYKDWYSETNTTTFKDVNKDQFFGAIAYANEHGIVKGTTATTFDPIGSIKYQDALTMLVRALGEGSEEMDAGYPDSFIEKAEELGITRGFKSNVKNTDRLTRGEVAKLLYNAFVEEKTDIPKDGIVVKNSVLYGKKVIALGDSITWGQSGYEPGISDNPWPEVVGQRTGAIMTNMGLPGSTAAYVGNNPNSDLNRDSLVHMADKLDFSEYDYVFMAYGTNDLSYGVPLGNNTDNNKNTFKGAFNYAIKTIKEKNPDITIIIVTAMLDSRRNEAYINAAVQIAKHNGLYCIDMRNLGITSSDLYDMYWDHSTQMHPTETVYYAMGAYISYYPNCEDVKCRKITFNPGSGYMDIKKTIVIEGEPIRTLLVTCVQGYEFAGWYTKSGGKGELVTGDTIYNFGKNITLYAKFVQR